MSDLTSPEDLGQGSRRVPPRSLAQEPFWIVVRATVALSSQGEAIYPGQQATVDATLPHIREQLAQGWIVPIPAALQPKLVTDENGEPALAEEEGTDERAADNDG